MYYLQIIILAVVQGLAELLPVSSSAHVIIAAKIMHLPHTMSSPQGSLLLALLHTGTMFAVILYFWKQWKLAFFASKAAFQRFAILAVIATLLTAAVGYPLKIVIENALSHGQNKAEIEELFDRLDFVAPALAAAGFLILIAGLRKASTADATPAAPALEAVDMTYKQAGLMGAIQGLCLPFRGFSRSGATISLGMLTGVTRHRAEIFSFALAVIITPPVVARELSRVLKASHDAGAKADLTAALAPGLFGMVCAFLAGLVALKWLSSWLEKGRWYLFGIYCLVMAGVVLALHLSNALPAGK